MNGEKGSIEEMKWWRKASRSVWNWLKQKDKDRHEWLNDMRGMLSLVGTVIATITFQSAINPPGGVRPANENGNLHCPDNRSDNNPCPGEAVLAVVFPDDYSNFLLWNTTCFVSSLAVCLLLVSGIPLKHRFSTWLLSIAMCLTLSTLTLTYVYAAQMVTPNPLWGKTMNMFVIVILIWISLLGLVTLFLFLRLIVWIVSKCKRSDSRPTKFCSSHVSTTHPCYAILTINTCLREGYIFLYKVEEYHKSQQGIIYCLSRQDIGESNPSPRYYMVYMSEKLN